MPRSPPGSGIAKNTVIVHMVRALAHCRRAIETVPGR